MKTKIVLALAAVAALCAAQPLRAHHAFAAEYDVSKPVELKGTLSKAEWVNPHGWMWIDVKQPNGTVRQWQVELAGPAQLARRGLKKTDFNYGMTVVVKGYAGKKEPTHANGRTLVLPDGRSVYVGSPGGPNDGADK
jgi:hypothetical protein